VTILYAIPVGIVAGFLLGGRVEGVLALRFRWPALAIGGLLVQVVLFSELGDRLAGDFDRQVYVLSTLAVLGAVLRNLALPGLPLVALGALSNLAAIVANGGLMPADPVALRIAGFDGPGEHTNSIVLADPALRQLTDIFALPAGIPFANVFSVGDVLIAVGIAWAIVGAMRSRTGGASAETAT